MQNLKENWLMTWKLACSQKSENVHFDRLLLSKAYKVLDEKVHWRVISHDTEEWCEAWRETESWFQKWYEEFGEFYCEQWQVLCHNTEEWCKIWGELTYAINWRVMEYLKKNWLLVWKMTFDYFFEQSLVSKFGLWWARVIQSI